MKSFDLGIMSSSAASVIEDASSASVMTNFAFETRK